MFRGVLASLIASTGYGIIPVLSKLLLVSQLDSRSLLVWQSIVGALVLFLYLKKKGISFKPTPAQTRGILLVAISDGATTFLLYEAYQRIDVGLATIMHFIYPVVVMVVMTVVFRERATVWKVAALIVSIAGMLIMTEVQGVDAGGIALAAGSGLCFATCSIANQKSRASELSPALVAFYSLLTLFVFFLLLTLSTQTLAPAATGAEWGTIAMIGVLKASGVCLGIYAVQAIGSTRTSILGMVELVTAILAGAVFFHEVLADRQIIGGIAIAAGALLIIFSGWQEERATR